MFNDIETSLFPEEAKQYLSADMLIGETDPNYFPTELLNT